MRLTPEKELAARTKLKTDLLTVGMIGSVFIKPAYFTSKADFVEQLGNQVAPGDDLEVQFCQVSFLKFEDSKTDGCADDPLVYVHYKIHLFHEFRQARKDGTNSHDTFVALILNLRNKFLLTQDAVANSERSPLAQEQFMLTDTENEFFPGAFGHYTNLITKIEVS